MYYINYIKFIIISFHPYQDILHNLKRKLKSFNFFTLFYILAFRFHYFSSRVFILIIISIVFYFLPQFILLIILYFLLLFISNHATVVEVVGPVLYFRWPVKGSRSDRLVLSSTRSELGLVVERCLCNPAPMVRDLCLAPAYVVGTQGVPLLGHCRNPLLVTTGKYHPSIDFRKSIDVSCNMRTIERVDFSSITYLI